MEQTPKGTIPAGLKKHWKSIVILLLLAVVAVLLGIVYTGTASLHVTQLVGSYCVDVSGDVPHSNAMFRQDTYSFTSDNAYYKYGQYTLLEEGRVAFVDDGIFRLTSTDGAQREILLIDDVVYEQNSDGHFQKYYFALKVPALYGEPLDTAPPSIPLSCLDTYSAIKNDGSLLVWGDGFGCAGGQEFYTNNEYCGDIYKVIDNALDVAIGQWASFAIDTDEVLWGWGSNHYRQLPGKSESDVLTQIMTDTISVSVGAQHCLAIKNDKSLWGWGQNDYGQLLGAGSDSPEMLLENVVAAEACGYSSYALLEDGSLWAWGSDTPLNMGNSVSAPTKIMDHVSSFAAGFNEVMMIKEDFSLWVMGCANQQGESRFAAASTPTKIMEDVAYCGQGLVVKRDGTLLMWRDNKSVDNDVKEPIINASLVLIMDHVICAQKGMGKTLILTDAGELWALDNSDDVFGPNGLPMPYKIMSDIKIPQISMDFSYPCEGSTPTIYNEILDEYLPEAVAPTAGNHPLPVKILPIIIVPFILVVLIICRNIFNRRK